jgi:hypothetical protein
LTRGTVYRKNADRRPQTADRGPQIADRRTRIADRGLQIADRKNRVEWWVLRFEGKTK